MPPEAWTPPSQDAGADPSTPPLEQSCSNPSFSLDAVWRSQGDDPFIGWFFGDSVVTMPGEQLQACVTVTIEGSCGSPWGLEDVAIGSTSPDHPDGWLTFTLPTLVPFRSSSDPHVCVPAPLAEHLTLEIRVGLRHDDGHREFLTQQAGTPRPAGYDALSIVEDTAGTVWLGTLQHGLVGISETGETQRFPGVPLDEPYDSDFEGPQSSMITSLMADPLGEGLWVGGFVTGLSWFHPASGTWDHYGFEVGQALADGPPGPLELAETAFTLAPAPGGALWVGTGNGLYLMDPSVGPNAATFERVVDGVMLTSTTRDDSDELWAGVSQEIVPSTGDAPFWPQGLSPLVVVAPASSPGGKPQSTWLTIPARAVLSLDVSAERALVGTSEGLLVTQLTHGTPPSATPAWTQIDLEAVLGDGPWAVVSIAEDGDGGHYLGVIHPCGSATGGLIHMAAGSDGDWELSVVSGWSGGRGVAVVTPLSDGRLALSTQTLDFYGLKGAAGPNAVLCASTSPPSSVDVFVGTPADDDWEPLR